MCIYQKNDKTGTLTKNEGSKVFKKFKELELEVLSLLNFKKAKTGGPELAQRIAQH